jgi:mRNA-degrading endonuclease RelE of RelBE toxin-antitoxin system
MTIRFSKPFVRQYTKLSASVRKKVDQQLRRLAENARHPSLSARKMTNQGDIWEARVDYHYRVTFQMTRDLIILRRVGTHAIYRKP